MALTDTYSQIGDAIRQQYGTNDKYSLADMSKMIGGLEIHNYLEEGQNFNLNSGDYRIITGLDLDGWNKLIGKTVTLSYDLEYSGYKRDDGVHNRVTIEWGLYAEDGTATWLSTQFWPVDSSGKVHVSNSAYIQNKKITSIAEGAAYNQLNLESKVKFSNIKLVVNPLGGGNPG